MLYINNMHVSLSSLWFAWLLQIAHHVPLQNKPFNLNWITVQGLFFFSGMLFPNSCGLRQQALISFLPIDWLFIIGKHTCRKNHKMRNDFQAGDSFDVFCSFAAACIQLDTSCCAAELMPLLSPIFVEWSVCVECVKCHLGDLWLTRAACPAAG